MLRWLSAHLTSDLEVLVGMAINTKVPPAILANRLKEIQPQFRGLNEGAKPPLQKF
jgi:hypothetical protein